MKHTPGPWTVEEYGDDETPTLVIHKDSESRVCFMATPGSHGDPAKIEADAHLIAAAPDLLAALKEAQVFLNVGASYAPNTAESIKFATGEYLKTRGLADVMRAVAEKCDEAIKKAQING